MPDLLTTSFTDHAVVPWTGLSPRSVVFDDSGLAATEPIDISAIIAGDRIGMPTNPLD
jgi:hypothetical protein